MKLIFFNLCVSPHQMPYVNVLAHHPNVEYVGFVAPFIDIDERIVMGWNSAEKMNDKAVDFHIAPSDSDVEKLFELHRGDDTHCIFAGINAFKQVAHWFKMSIKYNVKRSIMTEPPMIYERPLWMHALRFAIFDWRYVKHIDNMFVMGDRFVPYYQMWSKHWYVWPFMYCTNLQPQKEITSPTDEKLHVIYVGELCHRKNTMLLFKAIANSKILTEKVCVEIVGNGADWQVLEKYANENKLDVKFHGSQPMNKVSQFMQQNDVLVLPSRHDGWGAVVNEALSLGLYVLCSDHCGSRYLINKLSAWNSKLGSVCGQVFHSCDVDNLTQKLQFCINNLQLIRQTTTDRVSWSEKTISSQAVAQRMINILTKD